MFLASAVASLALTTPPTVMLDAPFDPVMAGEGQVIAQIAIDADFEFFALNGMDVDATTAAIEEILNEVAGAFEQGPGVIFDVTAIVIRTDPNDPYTSSDAATLFQQAKNEWDSLKDVIEWDAVQLISGKNLNGGILGIAGLSSICTPNAISVITPAGLPFTGQAHLSAHEFGHVFGASNCTDAPDCGVMCSTFFGCAGNALEFGQDAIADIHALIDVQGDCLAPAGNCVADCDADGELTILDFVCFQGLFNAGDPAADCDNNGALNILDFVCFQTAFQAGCD